MTGSAAVGCHCESLPVAVLVSDRSQCCRPTSTSCRAPSVPACLLPTSPTSRVFPGLQTGLPSTPDEHARTSSLGPFAAFAHGRGDAVQARCRTVRHGRIAAVLPRPRGGGTRWRGAPRGRPRGRLRRAASSSAASRTRRSGAIRPGTWRGRAAPASGDRAQLRLGARRDDARRAGARPAPNGGRRRPAATASSRSSPSTRSAPTRPLTQRQRLDFAAYAVAILHAMPGAALRQPRQRAELEPVLAAAVRHAAATDAAAGSYFRLLAHGLPGVKAGRAARDRDRRLAGGARQRQPVRAPQDPLPTRFILDLGRELRASGLREAAARPLLAPPVPGELVDPADGRRPALDGDRDRRLPEARPAPHARRSGSRRRSSTASTASRRRSRGASSTSTPGSARPSIRPVSEARQADDYVAAIQLAACQPLVRMLVFFHVTDESAFTGLQTGLYYPNERPKAEPRAGSPAWARAAEKGQVKCRS